MSTKTKTKQVVTIVITVIISVLITRLWVHHFPLPIQAEAQTNKPNLTNPHIRHAELNKLYWLADSKGKNQTASWRKYPSYDHIIAQTQILRAIREEVMLGQIMIQRGNTQ